MGEKAPMQDGGGGGDINDKPQRKSEKNAAPSGTADADPKQRQPRLTVDVEPFLVSNSTGPSCEMPRRAQLVERCRGLTVKVKTVMV